MLTQVTIPQLEVVRRAFDDHGMSWVGEVWLDQAMLLPGHTTTVECVMPAIGWQRSLSLLIELTVGPLGGNRESVKAAAFNARNAIALAIATYQAHPALFGVGLYGAHFEVIPAWTTGGSKPARLYDVIPVKNAAFVHLYPERDGPFTVWRAQRVLSVGEGGSVLDEAEHLRFLGLSDPVTG
jgi:hypothetical protein